MPIITCVEAKTNLTAPTGIIYPITSIGIDVSKAKLDIALHYTNREYSSFVFRNDSGGISSLVKLLQKQGTAETVPCIIESTGNYHLQSSIMLTQAKFAVKVINPLITKKYQKSSIRNAKSDPIDAKRLAQIGLLEPELPLFKANKDIISAKKVVSYLGQLEKAKQRMMASSKQLRETEKCLGRSFNLDATDEAIKAISEQIKELKKGICLAAPSEVNDLSDNINGLSKESISILLCLLSDKHFDNRDQLTAFVGMDLAIRKSGKWQGQEKLTKRGEPLARKVLYQIAWGLKQHNPIYKKYYDRLYRNESKHYNTAMIAVARKFLRFLHAYYWKRTIVLENS